MRTDVLEWLDLDTQNINKAFDNMYALFYDLDMNKEADDVITELKEALKNNKDVIDWYSPTQSFIKNMFQIASRKITTNYPNANVGYTIPIDGYHADINVDNATFKLADERMKEKYE